jgi:GT2 family glycosyltransferase
MGTPSPVPASTIIMVPRESFAEGPASVSNVCAHRENGARLVVVDPGSPPRVQRALEDLARRHDFSLIRVDRYLPPNQARNLAIEHLTTKFAVFLDNNVRVSPGWLDALERCATETGAAVVAPTSITIELGRSEIHQMGGEAHVAERDGVRSLRNSHLHQGDAVERRDQATRRTTEEAEFHSVLVATTWLERFGGLDPELLSLYEHTDLCMRVRDAGGSVWFEPDAVVSYGRSRFVDRRDRAYYVLRWSEEWNERSSERFQATWDLDADPYPGIANWTTTRRRYAYRPFTTPLNRIGRFGRPIVDLVDRFAQRRVVARWERSRHDPAPARLSHRASWQTTEQPTPTPT